MFFVLLPGMLHVCVFFVMLLVMFLVMSGMKFMMTSVHFLEVLMVAVMR